MDNLKPVPLSFASRPAQTEWRGPLTVGFASLPHGFVLVAADAAQGPAIRRYQPLRHYQESSGFMFFLISRFDNAKINDRVIDMVY